ncbi:hypothetical protein Tco_1084496 [Tanacetum coccineum]
MIARKTSIFIADSSVESAWCASVARGVLPKVSPFPSTKSHLLLLLLSIRVPMIKLIIFPHQTLQIIERWLNRSLCAYAQSHSKLRSALIARGQEESRSVGARCDMGSFVGWSVMSQFWVKRRGVKIADQ